MSSDRPLKIIHCFRSPVGGIFRHVRDLVEEHASQGHQVGIFCDSSTGGVHEEKLFDAIKPKLALGLTRIPMRRAITPGDMLALKRTYSHFKNLKPDVLHSHGAKGGAYARIIGSLLRVSGQRVARLYCPHGGSIHYDGRSLKGRLFFALERTLERMTDRLIFVSQYELDGYVEKVGTPRCPVSLVYNGLSENDYKPVGTLENAADFLYIGMMRDLKGPDVFIDAINLMKAQGKNITAQFVGDGPDKAKYISRIEKLGLGRQISVHDAMPARKAFETAKTVVIPSRAESMPYIVLEAIAAEKPVICTNVGGIPEIFVGEIDILVKAGDATALSLAMTQALESTDAMVTAKRRRIALKQIFSVEIMARDVLTAYRSAMDE